MLDMLDVLCILYILCILYLICIFDILRIFSIFNIFLLLVFRKSTPAKRKQREEHLNITTGLETPSGSSKSRCHGKSNSDGLLLTKSGRVSMITNELMPSMTQATVIPKQNQISWKKPDPRTGLWDHWCGVVRC